MEHGIWNKISKLASLIFLLVFIDQASKYMIRLYGGFYVCNTNIAFGIPIPPAIFWIFWIIIIIAISLSLQKLIMDEGTKKKLEYWGLSLVLAGALANIIDRLTLGCVIDFIDLQVWPAFNLADVFISVGVVFLLAKWRKMC